MKYLPLDPAMFIRNRKSFVAKMDKNAIAIFNSNDELPMNGDALYKFKQNSDLYWLCGIEQEDSMVILFPDNPDPKFREVLVLVRPNELKEKWDGKRWRADAAKKSQRHANSDLVGYTGCPAANLDTSRRYHLPQYERK